MVAFKVIYGLGDKPVIEVQFKGEDKTCHPEEGFFHGPHQAEEDCWGVLGYESERRRRDCTCLSPHFPAPGSEGCRVPANRMRQRLRAD